MAEKSTIVAIKGKAMYAKVVRPDTKYAPKWVVDILLDAEGIELAKKHKIRTRKSSINKKTQQVRTPYENLYEGYDGTYIRTERFTHKQDGTPIDPPFVVDSKKRNVPSSVQIGNGSDVKVQVLVKNRNLEALEEYGGFGTLFLGIMIINLVPYDGAGADDGFEEEVGGFEISDAPTPDSSLDDEMPF